MRVTTFLTGLTIGAMAGIYLADRRSFGHLQSKLQIAGDVANDVMGMAKNRVVDTALESLAQATAASSQVKTSQSSAASVSKEQHTPRLDLIKELIDRDPEVKRQVDAILRESGAARGLSATEAHMPVVVAHEAPKSSSKSSANHQSSH